MLLRLSLLRPVSRNSRKTFGPEKPLVELRPAYSVKLVFSYAVKGIKIKRTAKFRASKRLRFEDTNRIRRPEMRPVSQKSRELCGPEKPFVKVRPAYSAKLVFSYVVKGIKTKISFVPRDAFVLKIHRELCHPKYARKVSELLRNRSLASLL